MRLLRSEDIGQVLEIEKEAFSPLWVSTPFKRELSNRYACYLVVCDAAAHDREQLEDVPEDAESSSVWGRVVNAARRLVPGTQSEPLTDESVSGFVSVWYQGEEAHITEIAVREKMRGNGLGELLLIGSLREACKYGSKVMTLEARVSNFIAQRLYEKYGFKSVGIRKGYYADNREDAVIMTTNPIQTEEYQEMFRKLQETYRARWREINFRR